MARVFSVKIAYHGGGGLVEAVGRHVVFGVLEEGLDVGVGAEGFEVGSNHGQL